MFFAMEQVEGINYLVFLLFSVAFSAQILSLNQKD
jgi:hypothetical protein